jgi:hypothetical protein
MHARGMHGMGAGWQSRRACGQCEPCKHATRTKHTRSAHTDTRTHLIFALLATQLAPELLQAVERARALGGVLLHLRDAG